MKNFPTKYTKNPLLVQIYQNYYNTSKFNHLDTHIKLIKGLYDTINVVPSDIDLDQILNIYYIIINTCDDLIDHAPLESQLIARKDIMLLFSGFIFLFNELSRCPTTDHLFEVINAELDQLIDAPLKEYDISLQTEFTDLNIVEYLYSKQINRCKDHKFIINVLNAMLAVDKRINFVSIVVLLKALEFFIRDCSVNELSKDLQLGSFNVIIFMTDKTKTIDHLAQLCLMFAAKIDNEWQKEIFQLPISTQKLANDWYLELKERFTLAVQNLASLPHIAIIF